MFYYQDQILFMMPLIWQLQKEVGSPPEAACCVRSPGGLPYLLLQPKVGHFFPCIELIEG
ncbi:MAG: hypothetical protein JOY96_07720 [Verrucomicrobia bacterium]|nr:hypothetical protein [Verrucomicrobiota bacterium]